MRALLKITPPMRSHACRRFIVDTTAGYAWAFECSCGTRSGGWATRDQAIDALMRHLGPK